MGVACLEFRGENFHGWLKNHEIRESFLPRKFPTIRYNSSSYLFSEVKEYGPILQLSPTHIPPQCCLAVSSSLHDITLLPRLITHPMTFESSPLRNIFSSLSKMASSSSVPVLMIGSAKGIKTARVEIL